ncbi:MAG: hypothetical protein LBB24_00480 [Rickettsiales bacterium]|jgi:hypothetical protein|nr:hypothetical protein [Rickettsiales bacterium]
MDHRFGENIICGYLAKASLKIGRDSESVENIMMVGHSPNRPETIYNPETALHVPGKLVEDDGRVTIKFHLGGKIASRGFISAQILGGRVSPTSLELLE